MFDVDGWQEIIAVARRNKLRTFLTACGVFWGLFMLVVMLGFGHGLERRVTTSMSGMGTNAVYVWARRTSMPYKGMQPGRRVRLTNGDIRAIESEIKGIEYLAPRTQLGGWRSGNNVTRGARTGNFTVMGDYPAIPYIQPIIMTSGRFINERDIEQRRKVAIIGKGVYDELFPDKTPPVGESIKINGVYFQIVGAFRVKTAGAHGDRQSSTIYIPFTTFQQSFNTGPYLGWFALRAAAGYDAGRMENDVRELLAKRHKVHPRDRQAFGSFNAGKEFRKVRGLFGGIQVVVWFVGIVTLLAGVVGVSNIMLVAVNERIREFGVRKALGATPWSIIAMIMQEAVVLTALAGYTGLVIGVGLLELLRSIAPGALNGIVGMAEIDIRVALIAATILVISGAIAGIIPAQRAVRIRPIEALRSE
jgi:putative ABC transport system permease protein